MKTVNHMDLLGFQVVVGWVWNSGQGLDWTALGIAGMNENQSSGRKASQGKYAEWILSFSVSSLCPPPTSQSMTLAPSSKGRSWLLPLALGLPRRPICCGRDVDHAGGTNQCDEPWGWYPSAPSSQSWAPWYCTEGMYEPLDAHAWK